MLPSVDAAVIVTVFPFPAFLAVTLPFLLTVAYLVLELCHFKVLFTLLPVVFTVALTVMVLPAFNVLDGAFSFMLFTACFMILILQVAFLPLPSLVAAVTVTVFPIPAFFRESFPFWSIVAYFLLLVFHVTALLLALDGVMSTVSLTFFPAASFLDGALIVNWVTVMESLLLLPLLPLSFSF